MDTSGPLLHDLACVVHLHSTYSDGTGTVDQIAAAGRRNSLDVVLLTDHDTLAGAAEEGWHGSVLLLVGEEVSPLGRDHLLVFGVRDPIVHRGLDAASVCSAVSDAGAISFAAHPFSTGSPLFRRAKAMPHTAVARATGIELWSFVNDTGESLRSVREAARFVAAPERVVRHPPRRNLEEWDRLCARQRCVAIGGLDAHQIGVRVGNRVPLRLMSYARSFRYLRTHVLSREPLSGELEPDRASVFEALGEGRCYIARDSLAPARGFAFWADGVVMGEEAEHDGQTLRVSLPRPAELRLFRDGRPLETVAGSRLERRTEAPGVYRVEAHLDGRTWIISNPIYLR